MTAEETVQLALKYRLSKVKAYICDNPVGVERAFEFEFHESAYAPAQNVATPGALESSSASSEPIGMQYGNPSYEEMLHYSSIPMTDDEIKHLEPKDE